MTSAHRIGEVVRTRLDASSVEHRPNHTGAGKLSYTVARGAERLWVRVAADVEEHEALLRWAEHAPRLTARYHAPPVLDVLVVEGRTTLVFPHLHEPPADRTDMADRAGQLLTALADLHADAELGRALGPPVTAGEAFSSVWLRRFLADLSVIEGYVDRDAHALLSDEVELLGGLLRGPAFDEPVHSPVHGDPWHENVLLGPVQLWLLDWEDLAVGDPVVDEAIVLMDAYGPDERWPVSERHDVARRALLLDRALDVAADWVESSDPLVRWRQERAWRAGLETYRATYC